MLILIPLIPICVGINNFVNVFVNLLINVLSVPTTLKLLSSILLLPFQVIGRQVIDIFCWLIFNWFFPAFLYFQLLHMLHLFQQNFLLLLILHFFRSILFLFSISFSIFSSSCLVPLAVISSIVYSFEFFTNSSLVIFITEIGKYKFENILNFFSSSIVS